MIVDLSILVNLINSQLYAVDVVEQIVKSDEDWAPYENLDPALPHPDYPDLDVKSVKRKMREYLASISGVDRNLGRLLDTLEESGIADSTVVIFTSDHGYNMGHNGIWHKGNGHWVVKPLPKPTPNIPRGQRPNM